ncbi:hypothetical protein L3X38_011060 [Prunus dulcis]|uniref:Uncharacterized protein n=1 Tax=Prunus dulcis TaxID=3755 RepID=A0AAD4WH26_PRUDU|nr:hypothetical protein L3X38_011060 [Prunus dulcis]
MSNVCPPNDHVSYLEDQPWHMSFPSPPLTPNHDPTSSGSEAESNDPLDKISAMKLDLQYLSKATDWCESKCDSHGQVMGNLANKLNNAYAREVKQTLKAISRRKELVYEGCGHSLRAQQNAVQPTLETPEKPKSKQ